MYAPRFPKPQTEGFFVLVCNRGGDELLALKRVAWPGQDGGKTSVKSAIRLPPSFGEREVDVLVASDGYIGLEWPVCVVKLPAAPAPQGIIDKESKP